MPSGILLLDKPEGMRSTDCVTRVKRFFREKTGHAGTLDSTACGLLIMLIGCATRLSDFIMLLPKIYTAVVRIGAETDTADASGDIVFSGDAHGISENDVDCVLNNFIGEIMQAPPEISAVKVGGKAAHRIMRSIKNENAGTTESERKFSLPERSVHVYDIKRTSPLSDCEFEIEVRCGKGTYIRSIARDIGRTLGCGGHVVKLRRLSVGNFSVNEACDIDELSMENLLPSESMAAFYDRVLLNAGAEACLSNGLRTELCEAGDYIAGEIGSKHIAVLGKELFGFAEIKTDAEVTYLYPHVNVRRTVQ